MRERLLPNERGTLNGLLIPLIMAIIFLLAAIGFGAWAYSERQTYKDRTDEKVAAAVAVAVQQAKSEKDNEFLQREKEPLKTYSSPASYGSFILRYPKTWSAYSDEKSNTFAITLQQDVVSSNTKTPYSLKVEVLSTPYSQEVSKLENEIKQGKLSASVANLAKVPGVTGLRVDGQVALDKRGAAVYLPLRDKTIRIVTESPDKIADFNNIILPNFEFSP